MGKIVVIGGGELEAGETLLLDRQVVKMTDKKKPNALFIPTASEEAEGYIMAFEKIYGSTLGCTTDTLYCLGTRPNKSELKRKILGSDLIYVGGGNTLKMMRRWRLLGIDRLLVKAHDLGVVLSGLSAGGISMFEGGHSDSMSFYDPTDWNYIRVRGLGLLRGTHCPHFDGNTGGKPRRADFAEFMHKRNDLGIAVDNKCAIEFVDGTYRVVSASSGAGAYKVFRSSKVVQIEHIEEREEFSPIEELYKGY